MKFLLFSCACIAGLLFSTCLQAQNVTLHLHQTTLPKVLTEVSRQTGYTFVYDPHEMDKKIFDIDLNDTPMTGVLQYCQKLIPIQYKIIDKNVVIKLTTPPPGQKFTFSAYITDEEDHPIPEVFVYIPRLQKFLMADKQGNITIPDMEAGDSIQLNYMGFDQLIAVISQPEMKFKMSTAENALDEVVVLAYGQTVNKRLNTGSSVKITATDIEKTATMDPLQALSGRVPGLVITPSSGLAGAYSNINIRGVNSMGLTNNGTYSVTAPLFIVDGIPFNNNTLSNISTATYSESPFKSIDPSSIESIQVLKDADATAIYGARGANGVILITTKKNTGSGLQFSLDASTTIQKIPKHVPMLDISKYRAMRRQGFANDGVDIDSTNAPDLVLWDSTINHDWQKEYFNKAALMHNVQFSVSAGGNYNSFRLAAGYGSQSTIYNSRSGLRKGNFSFSGNHTSKDGKLQSNVILGYSTDHNDVIPMSLTSFVALPPNFSLYNADGSLNWSLANTVGNPIAAQKSTFYNQTQSFTSSINTSYLLGKGWEAKITAGYNRMQLNEFGKNPLAAQAPGSGALANAQKGNNITYTLNIEPQLTYNFTSGKNHFDVLLGGTYMRTLHESRSQYATGFTNDDELTDFSKAQAVNYYYAEGTYKFLSGFTRLSYNYDEKYVLNLTGRRDGSSRFGPGRKYGNFGSVGAAWNFSSEHFFQWMKPAISFAKLRASYGITGSDAIGDYQYFVNYILSQSTYENVQGYHANNLFNDKYQWETTRKIDIGMELGAWKNRIMLTVDYFRNRSGNQLVAYTLPSFVGNDNVPANLNALIENSGVEMTFQIDPVKKKNFSWTSSFNISFARNKLVAFPGLENSPYRSQFFLNKSISPILGYRNAVVNPADGTVTVDDVNKDGVISPDYDYTYLGSSLPHYTGGIDNRFTYKNFTLDVFLSFKNQDYTQFYDFKPGSIYNQPAIEYGNVWEQAGDVKKFPKASAAGNNDGSFYYYNNSLAAYYSGSYLRISSVSANYLLPEKWFKKLHITRLNIYALVNNLWTFTSNPGFDPETGMNMPNLRAFTLGIRSAF
ncbi:SusC/RagA family TonB-linked outer membrane protein [Chitinophaga silvisoli]|uniref:SusC/RagA family TonB-linked outer membrane protein n=1 Tax=Chitinophaga silvisoli TaxID=2291814 RepID=A0A3E1NVT2_9BACT|nr:SusC/RagA family TonB-linked outer membrane protein [Chitinophaga silvisoli]RFM32055.1 SusC/RagA family TonB-linked outer membrane protein [Chitinophaga silvisoli]